MTTYNTILNEFHNSDIKIINEARLIQYIDFCLMNNKEQKITKETSHHHILPNSLFPEYKNLKENLWNGTHLLYSEHYYAHWLLTEAIDDYGQLYAFCAMHNKDMKLGRINEGDLIPKDEFQEKMKERSNKQREWYKNNPLKAKEQQRKRLQNIDWESQGEKISRGLMKIELNGKSVAQNTAASAVSKNLSLDPDTYKKRAIKRLENMSPEDITNATNKMVKTRKCIGKNGLSSYQEGAIKGSITRKNTILENGLTIEADAIKRSIKTRELSRIEKYGDLAIANMAIYGGKNNPWAKTVHLYNSQDELVTVFDTRIDMINSSYPTALDKTHKNKRLFSSIMYKKHNKKGELTVGYKRIIDNGDIVYKGWYIIKS